VDRNNKLGQPGLLALAPGIVQYATALESLDLRWDRHWHPVQARVIWWGWAWATDGVRGRLSVP
jgi:hypothetical protein